MQEASPRRYVFHDRTVITDGARRSLERHLREAHPGASWNDVRRLVRTGKVSVNGERVEDPRCLVAGGSALGISMNEPRQESRASASITEPSVVHIDSQLVVALKPAGLSSVPYPGELDSFEQRLRSLLKLRQLYVVHRLDKETTGLLVFARTLQAQRQLQQQWRRHTVRRHYLALVQGTPKSRTIVSNLVLDRGDGRRGSTRNPKLGRRAVTHVELVQVLRGAALVRCRLETGRTHQIRIHLAEAGHPLLGERVYLDLRKITPLPAPRVMLHAASLGFEHPTTGVLLDYESAIPDDMQELLQGHRVAVLGRVGP